MLRRGQLVEALLWEGYALYPYTPTATKNATPTPFGIVYPPAYAAGLASTYDHVELRCVLRCEAAATVAAEVWFLAPAGEGHRASEQRLALPPATVVDLRSRLEREATVAGALSVAIAMWAEPVADAELEIVLRIENRTPCEDGLSRAGALARSLLSTHPVLRVDGGRFASPLDAAGGGANTFPVLAADDDSAVVGAAIVLPDHPQIAPESQGGLFDSTEIEEALLLHVHALSDAEREEIARADPAVREMVERAAAAAPASSPRLHGRVTLRDPETTSPPEAPPGLTDPSAGEEAASVDGITYRRGDHVRIRPAPDADLHARHAGRPRRDHRADLHRLRRQDALRRHDRRRPRPAAAARDQPVPVLLRTRAGGGRMTRELRFLVAGVGNAWLRDDGFGGEVARRLRDRPLQGDVAVMDAGTGGLDLAYEVMRGYDALIILDVSRQGGDPGTLYVMEPDEQSVDGAIEDGSTINPHGMDPQTVLRFIKSIGAWPGQVIVIACEPVDVEELGFGLSNEVAEAVERAAELVHTTLAELRATPSQADAGPVGA